MSKTAEALGCAQLDELHQSIDGCRARDIPSLHKQLRRLRRQCEAKRPDVAGLQRLGGAVAASRQWVAERRAAAPKVRYAHCPLLPVVEKRAEILEAIERNQVLVLCGETGSGKTTQLPKFCLDLGLGTRGRIGHTQPRRIAARSVAERIAEELGGSLGEQVGYKVRFQDRVRDSSYVKVMTDGILLAEIQSDPELREYDTLIVDEAHERSLNIDFLLGYLHRLLPRRPDLKLIITSATINPKLFSDHFANAPVIDVSGRTYPVEIRYRPLKAVDEDQEDRDRGQAILAAVDELAAEGTGDVLVFLPGERAIRETAELLRKHHPPSTEILPLYARLSVSQQARVFAPHQGRRVILATNVAETSLTVPGIHYVVDTGLARTSRYCYRTKVQRLPIEPVSQASACQRAGRCGRVAAGVCIRLYDQADYDARSAFTAPEIHRTNLAAVILQMAALGLGRVDAFPFLEPPDGRLVRDGYRLLHELGAVDQSLQLTTLGRQIARLPLDPRLARMVLAARELNCLQEVLVIVSALEVVDPRERPFDRAQAADEKHALFRDEKSDFAAYLRVWTAFQEQARHLSRNKLRKWCQDHYLSYLRLREWGDVHKQLRAQVSEMGMTLNSTEADYRAVHCALLSGLLGNIAFKTEPGVYTGARNLKFSLFPGSGLAARKPKWLVAAELTETGRRYLRTVAAIDPTWLEPLAGHLVKRSWSEPHWEKKRAQVVAFERVTLYGLPVVSRRKVNFGPLDPATAREIFIRHALVNGEFNTRAAFAAHNRELMANIKDFEARARRCDMLADEQDLFRFFDERIPAAVFDAVSFERWWRQAQAAQPQLLHLVRSDIMRHRSDAVTQQNYPDELEVRGTKLPLRYRFAPGEPDDGVCVQAPMATFSQLRAADFERLVPGLLEEKLMLLIKSLPKQWRRRFVPAGTYAQACLSEVQHSQAPLIDALAAALERATGTQVPRQAWRPEQLPAYLSVNYEVHDETGRRVDSGRDLASLQQRFASQAQQQFSLAADGWEQRRSVETWDFGPLPHFVQLQQNGVQLRAYPSLAVAQDGVELRLFDDQQRALCAHRQGLLILFRKQAPRVVKEIRRSIPDWDKQLLWFGAVGSAEALQSDIERAVLQAVFLEGEGEVRTAEAFHKRLQQGKPRLVTMAAHVGRCSSEALQAYANLSRRLTQAVTPAVPETVAEVREQMAELVYPGFVTATPLKWLPRLACYLDAARLRLEKLSGNLDRDRRNAAQVRLLRQSLGQIIQHQHPHDTQETAELRWLIEELRVSLFAQELGTVEKVSPQRLERALIRLRQPAASP